MRHLPAGSQAPAEPLALDEFERELAGVDLTSADALWAARDLLRRLGADPGRLAATLAREVADDPRGFQPHNRYEAHTLILAARERYLLRVNLWVPLGGAFVGDASDFSYGVAHNHNFHLLTLGLSGEGYETDLFELAEAAELLEPEQRVTLAPRGRARLGAGDVMLYEAYRDVHVQHPSRELSASLNLMTVPAVEHLPQHIFDIERRVVASTIEASPDGRHHLARAALDLLSREEGEAALRALAADDPSPRVRAAARRALNSSSSPRS